MLPGRHSECVRVGALLADVRRRRSGALVIRGAPGVGKSALLRYAAEQADGVRILIAEGVESEMELPFAALHQLFFHSSDELDRLPTQQAAAVRAALGLVPATDVDRFMVAAGVLTLLGELAGEHGLLCLVDDVHWVDGPSVQALLFAARRVEAEGVGLIFALRDGEAPLVSAAGLPDIELGPLDAASAEAVLADNAPGIAGGVRGQIIEMAAGNPLALIELARALTDDQRSGRVALPHPLPVGEHATRLFAQRLTSLSPVTRRLLEIAAADDTGDLQIILQAAESFDVGLPALHAAEQAGLIGVAHGRLTFHHPLMRSAVYSQTTFAGRQGAHRALAGAFGNAGQLDRRAWHLAAATVEPDESVASALEESAERAIRRGGLATAAAALERAADLTPAMPERARRLLAAAHAYWSAGSPAPAAALLDRAEPLVDAARQRAQLLHLRGLIEMRYGATESAYRLLIDSVGYTADADPRAAMRALAVAGEAASIVGDAKRVGEVGRLAADIAPVDTDTQILADTLIGIAAVFGAEWDVGANRLRAVAAAAEESVEPAALMSAGRAALYLGEQQIARTMYQRAASSARTTGALGLLTTALYRLAFCDAMVGRLDDAEASITEGLRLASDIGQDEAVAHLSGILTYVLATRGDGEQCRVHAEAASRKAAAGSYAFVTALTTWALGLLELGNGNPAAAIGHLQRLADDKAPGHAFIRLWSTADRIEAAVRSGQGETVRAQLDSFRQWAHGTAMPWAAAITSRCEALLAEPTDALRHYENAVNQLADSAQRRPFDEARTNLLYGEALRRAKHRSQSRAHLRMALETFEALGATPWAERARAELRASGETARRRDPSTTRQLTPQERQIAKYAGRGASNPEIAAAVFLSRRTVEYHLHKVFDKLGISSRIELAHLDLDAL